MGVAQDEEEKDGVGKEKIGSEVEENLPGLLSNDFKYLSSSISSSTSSLSSSSATTTSPWFFMFNLEDEDQNVILMQRQTI